MITGKIFPRMPKKVTIGDITVINGRTLKQGHMQFARPGLKKLKEKMNEVPGQLLPEGWK